MRRLKNMDFLLLITVLILAVFGLIMIFSATSASTVLKYGTKSTYFFFRQTIFLVGALLAGLFVFGRRKGLYQLAGFGGIIGIIILLIYTVYKGHVAGGAQSWTDTGLGASIQPAEFAKTILIIFMAEYYDIVERYNKPLGKKPSKLLIVYAIPLIIAFVLFYLIYKQPDFGSACILVGICGMVFFSNKNIYKFKKELVYPMIGLVILGICLSPIIISNLSEEQKSRFEFAHPCDRYLEDTGYQVCNGLIAMNEGGFLGVGLTKSTQKFLYLPESHTDFIFPIIVEETGALGGALVILAYIILLIRIYKIASRAEDTRNRLLAFGAFYFFTFHILINLLGVLALMPLTGVPLPFLSYGGSFLINAIVLIFIVERVNTDTKEAKFKKELKQKIV